MIEFLNVENLWLWLLLIAAGAWALFEVYRGMFQRSGRRLTWALMALRGAGLLALVLALAKPTWTRERQLNDPGRLAVVLDDSISMSLADESGKSRYAMATTAVTTLRDAVENGSDPRVELDLFNINGEAMPDELDEKPRREQTDLGRAISKTIAQLRSRLLTGIVLISDGVDNTGRDDSFRLAEVPVPVYSVGFRSDSQASRLDLAVRSVAAPQRVMVNNEIKVNVAVSKTAGPEIEATVTIKRGAEEFASTSVPLPDGSHEQTVALTFTPAEPGSFVYTATVSTGDRSQAGPGERLLENNSRHFPLQVEADAIRVLYVEGFLRYEYKFLKNRLEDDPDVSLATVVRRTNPRRLAAAAPEALFTSDRLEDLDLVILGDMEADYLTPPEYQALSGWVDRGHALLVLGGYRSFGPNGFRTTALAEILPVVFGQGSTQQSEDPFVLELTELGRRHPIFQVTGDRVKDMTLWSTAPHLSGSSLVQRAKPGAEVLAVNRNFTIDDQPAVVIATARYGAGHVMVITADTTWRWTRLTRVLGQDDTLYSRFWSQTVRWLTGRELDQQRSKLIVSTNRPDYEVGKEVRIRVVRPLGADAKAAADVAVEVADEAGKRTAVQVHTVSAEPNVFLGSYYPSSGGRYEVHASLTSQGEQVANERTEFLVHGSDLELADEGTNRALLQAISNRTGGVYVDIQDVATLAEKIDRKERSITRIDRTEYWNSPFLFLFFLTAVTSEWVIRRRNHLV